MSERTLANAPQDQPPVPMRGDEPVTDPGTKTNYPVTASDDVIPDDGKPHYPVEGE